MNPKHALKRWLDANEIKPGTFARRLGYDRGNFHRLLKPDSAVWPSLELALKIEQQTQSAIPMSAWAAAKAVQPQDVAA